jgi:hypothetical protein
VERESHGRSKRHFILGREYLSVLAYFPNFEKKNERSLFRSHCSLYVCVHPERQKTGIVEPEETAVARQRLAKHLPASTNTHTTVEELLDAVFSVMSVSYKYVVKGK